jgi:hypothetical protein
MSQVHVVRGQTRDRVLRKIQPMLQQGWQLQGAVAQESGWDSSTRYAATLVWNGHSAPGAPGAPEPAPARVTRP